MKTSLAAGRFLLLSEPTGRFLLLSGVGAAGSGGAVVG